MLYHVEEYLAGQAFPTTDVRQRRQDRAPSTGDARRELHRHWLAQKARFGFTEWHSDVYYQKTADALLTFIEFANDPARVERASMVLDLLLFDIALHLQQGNIGATHGRSYMKDKSVAERPGRRSAWRSSSSTTRGSPYQSSGDAGAMLFARARRYRLPAVIAAGRAAATRRRVDRERMGVPLDPHAPVVAESRRAVRLHVRRPGERAVLVGAGRADRVAGRADHHRASSTGTTCGSRDFFKPFKPLADIAGGDPDVARTLAQALASQISLRRCSARSTPSPTAAPTVMLSTAQSYRPGDFSEQAPHLAGDARRARHRVHDPPEERAAVRARSGPTRTATGPARARCRAPRSTARCRSASTRRRSRRPARRSTRSATSTTRTRTSRRSASTRSCRQGGWTFGRARRRLRRAVVVAADALAHLRRPGDLHPRPDAVRSTSSPTAAPTTCGSRRSATPQRSARSPPSAPRSSRPRRCRSPRPATVDGLAGRLRRGVDVPHRRPR